MTFSAAPGSARYRHQALIPKAAQQRQMEVSVVFDEADKVTRLGRGCDGASHAP